MAIPARGVSAPANAAREYHGFDRETLIQAFRIMQMARRIDDREVILKRQNRIWFQISAAGHEPTASYLFKEAIRSAISGPVKRGQGVLFMFMRASMAGPCRHTTAIM